MARQRQHSWGPKAQKKVLEMKEKYGDNWENVAPADERKKFLEATFREWLRMYGTNFLEVIDLKIKISCLRISPGTFKVNQKWIDSMTDPETGEFQHLL